MEGQDLIAGTHSIAFESVINIALTVAIAAATIVQARVARRLWKLQKSIEETRKQTFLAMGFEIKRTGHNNPPRQAFLRLENGSGIGITIDRVEVTAKYVQQTGSTEKLILHSVLGPYASREIEVSEKIKQAAMNADQNNPAWNSSAHSVKLRLVPYYRAEGKEQTGHPLVCSINFSAQHFESAEYLRDDEW